MTNFQKVAETAQAVLLTELRTGLTFAWVALDCNDNEKRNRTRLNARKAYDTYIKLRNQVALTADESRALESKLAELKACLALLGESFRFVVTGSRLKVSFALQFRRPTLPCKQRH